MICVSVSCTEWWFYGFYKHLLWCCIWWIIIQTQTQGHLNVTYKDTLTKINNLTNFSASCLWKNMFSVFIASLTWFYKKLIWTIISLISAVKVNAFMHTINICLRRQFVKHHQQILIILYTKIPELSIFIIKFKESFFKNNL